MIANRRELPESLVSFVRSEIRAHGGTEAIGGGIIDLRQDGKRYIVFGGRAFGKG